MRNKEKSSEDIQLPDEVKAKLLARKKKSEEEFGELDEIDLDQVSGGWDFRDVNMAIRPDPKLPIPNPKKTQG